MPSYSDFHLDKLENGNLTIGLASPTNISGWTLELALMKRFGSDNPVATKFCASGFDGVSGITVLDGNTGIVRCKIDSIDTSGLNYRPIAYSLTRLDSGFRTDIAQGYCLLGVSIGGGNV